LVIFAKVYALGSFK